MSIPNIGPELPDASDGNAAPVYRDDVRTDDIAAASTRASAVSHRFGVVRYALSRPVAPEQGKGESDESE